MAQGYSDPSRASDPYTLPDVEVFEQPYRYCPDCGSLAQDVDAAGLVHCLECSEAMVPSDSGFFWWYCLPGCLPDSEPFGPFKTAREAWDDVREQNDQDDDDSDPREA